MPKTDKDIFVEPMHTALKFDKESNSPEYVEQLNAIEVKLIGAPTIEEFRKSVSIFMMNTWNDKIQYEFDDKDIDRCIKQLFAGEILPTGMEIINLTFAINGMDMIDTTHLIRHRLFSFSAQAHGDRDMRDDRVVVKSSIMANSEFFDRYKRITDQAQALYMDMVDSGEVHMLDARTIMPRNFEHFYFARATIKDWIGYVRMRKDVQIQTTVDNIIALQIWYQIVKQYPFLKSVVDFSSPDMFYVNQCKEGKTNIFPPSSKNDLFEWKEEQFVHPKGREEYPGGEVYVELEKHWLDKISNL